jgi:hypothetical protein
MFPLAIAQQNNNKKAKTGIMNRRNCIAKEKRRGQDKNKRKAKQVDYRRKIRKRKNKRKKKAS